MHVSDDLFAVFSAEIEYRDGMPVVDVPEHELTIGNLEAGESYRVAVLPQTTSSSPDDETSASTSSRGSPRGDSSPPVEEGETLEVEIEDVGDQGDGIARIGPGYIVFVPDTVIGDRVTITITQARDNFAFAEVLEHEPVSER